MQAIGTSTGRSLGRPAAGQAATYLDRSRAVGRHRWKILYASRWRKPRTGCLAKRGRTACWALTRRPRTRSICGPPSRSGSTATARKWKNWRGPACLTRREGRRRSGPSGGGARPGSDAGQQCSTIRVGESRLTGSDLPEGRLEPVSGSTMRPKRRPTRSEHLPRATRLDC
jgi:hypothetical protein